MSNEELNQRGYLSSGELKGGKFGDFEELNIGSTSVRELKSAGLDVTIPTKIDFPFSLYNKLKTPGNAKPDRVFLRRLGGSLLPVATGEDKAPTKLRTNAQVLRCSEQGLFAAAAIGASLAITSNGKKWLYIDVDKSLAQSAIIYLDEKRDFQPGVLADLLTGGAGVAKDPAPLAETVWQKIWHATKEEPKQCLLTFVEIFVLKFLSDNLPVAILPQAYRFYGLLEDPKDFSDTHGMTAIEYYSAKIRPKIKEIFSDNTIVHDDNIAKIFGLSTVVSKTSIINGFAFLRSSTVSVVNFNRTFLDILKDFQDFGPLTTIDPQFKLRLYETFLKRSSRQQKLGQFFTPRNVVRPMVRMAKLGALPDGSVVLDPAAGVGGFVLEPPLMVPELAGNLSFANGKPKRRIHLVGVDVDASTHILAKANTLIHFAEKVRDPAITIDALNQLMAMTFILMNGNETLGSLENPPVGTVDVILTNPPYVTRGSGAYKDEVKEVAVGGNKVDLVDHYDRSGLGVEALFLRYICEALKPGGRAFVIVPLGLLNRTDPNPKKRILEDCNLIASIALPRNTFFNTAQLTYILVLEKRHTEVDARPDVFCGIARTIGETLNWERVTTPDENDLEDIAALFVSDHASSAVGESALVKIVPAASFTENDRWDVNRFWSEDELVSLGQKESAIPRTEFIDETVTEIDEIVKELATAREELASLTACPMDTVQIGDGSMFVVRSGTRVTGREIRENPGDLTIYSCFKTERETKGSVDENYFKSKRAAVVETKPIVTVNANGASVGKV